MNGTCLAQRDTLAEEPTLPVLPTGLPYLLSALGDEDLELHALAAVVGRFPPIAGRLLALANSAWVTPARPVTSLVDACALLGLRLVRSVSIALAAARPFDPSRCASFDVVRFWYAAFLTAEGAALLSPHLGEDCDGETLRTAGLLHNLGLLWLVDARPAQADQAFQATAANPELCLAQALRTAAGTDYCEAGGMLGESWGLPAVLTAAMRHHRDPDYRGSHWRLTAACGLAASMAAALRRGLDHMPEDGGASPLNLPPAASEALFRQLAPRRESIRALAHELFGR